MFVPSTIQNRLIRLGIARIGRDRRGAHRRADHTRARFRLEGLEDRCLLSGISGISEFAIPAAAAALSGITAGPDGNVWFTDRGDNAVGEINPTTHAISLYPVPTAGAWPFGIAAGPDGNIWFAEKFANKIGMINPGTHAIREFSLPAASNGGNGLAYPIGITAGPDGNLWFAWMGTGAGAIGKINPTTDSISYYPVSTSVWHTAAITAGPDGNLWFTTMNGLSGSIGEINPVTDAISYFAAPPASSFTAGTITSGPDGNVWFTEQSTGNLGMINPTTDAISELPAGNAIGITAGPDGDLWFAEASAGKIASINPTTDAVMEYAVPYNGATPGEITTGPDGNLWFTDPGTNAIGVATLATSQIVVTQQPPASLTAGIPFGLTVEAEDSSGNLIPFNGTVTVAMGSNPGGATLGGTLSVTASNGVATFSGLTLTKAASGYTLYASGGGFGWGVTNTITVTPAAPTQLVITQQPPATVKVNSGFGLQASIEDQYGNAVTTAANTVSVAFANNPAGATLGGTLSVTPSQGVAIFSGLTINKVGSGYTLQVNSNGLSSAVTGAFNVTKNGTSGAIVTAAAASAPDLSDGAAGARQPRFFG